MREQVSEAISPTKFSMELDLMFRLPIPPSIITIIFIVRVSIPIPTPSIISLIFIVPSGLPVTLLVQRLHRVYIRRLLGMIQSHSLSRCMMVNR